MVLSHAIFISNFLKSENTYFGIRLWAGFVYTTEKLGKNRFLLISIAPFVILPIILGLLDLLIGVIGFLILLNAIASSVDMLNTSLILVQVSNGSMIVNNGVETYYNRTV